MAQESPAGSTNGKVSTEYAVPLVMGMNVRHDTKKPFDRALRLRCFTESRRVRGAAKCMMSQSRSRTLRQYNMPIQ